MRRPLLLVVLGLSAAACGSSAPSDTPAERRPAGVVPGLPDPADVASGDAPLPPAARVPRGDPAVVAAWYAVGAWACSPDGERLARALAGRRSLPARDVEDCPDDGPSEVYRSVGPADDEPRPAGEVVLRLESIEGDEEDVTLERRGGRFAVVEGVT